MAKVSPSPGAPRLCPATESDARAWVADCIRATLLRTTPTPPPPARPPPPHPLPPPSPPPIRGHSGPGTWPHLAGLAWRFFLKLGAGKAGGVENPHGGRSRPILDRWFESVAAESALATGGDAIIGANGRRLGARHGVRAVPSRDGRKSTACRGMWGLRLLGSGWGNGGSRRRSRRAKRSRGVEVRGQHVRCEESVTRRCSV